MSCSKKASVESHPVVEVQRKSNSTSIFKTNLISVIFFNPSEGLVISFNNGDSERLRRATTFAPTLKDDVVVFLFGVKVGEIHISQGIGLGNGFIYLLGDFQFLKPQIETSGITIVEVDELPLSQEEIMNLVGP